MAARRLALSLTISLATLLGSTAAAQAAVCDTWHGPGGNSSEATSGEWGEKTSWSTGEVPSGQTEACITVPGTYTVSVKPYFGSNARVDVGAAETLTLGAASGTQTLKVIGENWNALGNEEHQTSLFVTYGMSIGSHGMLVLDASEGVSNGGKGNPGGGNAFVEEDVENQPGHPFVNEGTIVSESSSSKWNDGMHIHSMANSGSLQVNSPLKIESDESSSNTGSIATAPGMKLEMYNFTAFTNEGPVTNNGTFIVNGYPTKGKWIQGAKGSVTGNPVNIEADGGLEESAASGPGNFNLGGSGAAYVLGTIPKGQTLTFADATGQTTVFLGNATLVNEGTIHMDLPAGDESNNNIEEGSIVNRGTIYGTVEGANAKNVIDVPLANEPGGVVSASSGTLFDNRALANNGLLEIAPSALLELVAATLTDGSGGTIAPQIASAGSFGRVGLYSGATVEAGGTLAPTLVGGFTPTSGEEFKVFEGTVRGSFATVSGGFTGDYSHQSAESPYVGVIYGTAPPISSAPGTTHVVPPAAVTPRVTSIASVAGKLVVKLSCPAGGSGCGGVTVNVTVTEHLQGGRVTAVSAKHGGKAKSKTKVVVISTKSASLAAGKTASLSLSLNGTGAELLKKYRKLQALVTVSAAGRTIRTQKVTITAAKAKGKHR